MKTFFVTGASRGIGLGLVRHYASRPQTLVFAAARNPRDGELAALVAQSDGRVVPIELDVTNPGSIDAAAASVRDARATIDVLVNNAGISTLQALGEIDLATFLSVMTTNVAGPLMVIQALHPMLARDARIVNVSSRLGSLEHASGNWGLVYPASKAALNMISKQLSATLGPTGMTVVALTPGWVQTDMGSSNGRTPPLTMERSIEGISRVIDGLTHAQNGTFLQWDGATVAW